MKIQVIPQDYYNARGLTSTIERVIGQHPLIDASMSAVQKCLANMQIKVLLTNNFESTNICIDKKHNTIKLCFDPMCYTSCPSEFEKALFHEFTHAIDRFNPYFGINCQSEDMARSVQPVEMTQMGFSLYKHIWNCNIDGRLSQFGLNPKSLEERLREVRDIRTKSGGHFSAEVDKVVKNSWNAKPITFQEITNKAQECLKYWKPSA